MLDWASRNQHWLAAQFFALRCAGASHGSRLNPNVEAYSLDFAGIAPTPTVAV